jgi:flagellin-like protein
MKRESGVSPIIATILLIGIVLAMASIIFLWMRGFVKEEGTKFGKNVVLVCDDINFKASYDSGQLAITNQGNVPIFRVKVKEYAKGGYTTKDITDLSSKWMSAGLKQGEVFSDSVSFSGVTKLKVIPVLLGSTGKGEKVYTCADNYGYDISI